MPQTLRVKPETRRKLELIARDEDLPMTQALDKIVDAYQRQRLLEQTNAAFAALRNDSKAWREEQDERRLWEATLSDGLKDDGR